MTIAALALAPGNIIVWIIVGGIAGWVAGRLMGGGYGFIGDIVLGLIGAFIGGFIVSLFGVTGVAGFWATLLVAIVGAIILVAILRAVTHSTGSTGHSSSV